MASRRGLSMQQLNAIIEGWSDPEDEIDAVVILPPDRVDGITDDEQIDDDVIPNNDQVNLHRYFHHKHHCFNICGIIRRRIH